MNVYEYKDFYIYHKGPGIANSPEDINKIAEEGWELVSSYVIDFHVFGIFKRLRNDTKSNDK